MATVEELETELAAAKARVTELNQESAAHRHNAKEARDALTAAQAKHADDMRAVGEKLTAAEKTAKDAVDRATSTLRDAALKLAAKDAGIVDMDGLRLLDTSAVTVGEDGNVAIPKDFFAKAKEAKPYLFTQTGTDTGTTASTAKPPKADPGTPKKATDMTAEEYAIARAAVVARR